MVGIRPKAKRIRGDRSILRVSGRGGPIALSSPALLAGVTMAADTLRPIARALLSVSDNTGLIPFAQALAGRGVELLSTGGTAKALAEAGLQVVDVADVTGFP